MLTLFLQHRALYVFLLRRFLLNVDLPLLPQAANQTSNGGGTQLA